MNFASSIGSMFVSMPPSMQTTVRAVRISTTAVQSETWYMLISLPVGGVAGIGRPSVESRRRRDDEKTADSEYDDESIDAATPSALTTVKRTPPQGDAIDAESRFAKAASRTERQRGDKPVRSRGSATPEVGHDAPPTASDDVKDRTDDREDRYDCDDTTSFTPSNDTLRAEDLVPTTFATKSPPREFTPADTVLAVHGLS